MLSDGFAGICPGFLPQYFIRAMFDGLLQPISRVLSKGSVNVEPEEIYLFESKTVILVCSSKIKKIDYSVHLNFL